MGDRRGTFGQLPPLQTTLMSENRRQLVVADNQAGQVDGNCAGTGGQSDQKSPAGRDTRLPDTPPKTPTKTCHFPNHPETPILTIIPPTLPSSAGRTCGGALTPPLTPLTSVTPTTPLTPCLKKTSSKVCGPSYFPAPTPTASVPIAPPCASPSPSTTASPATNFGVPINSAGIPIPSIPSSLTSNASSTLKSGSASHPSAPSGVYDRFTTHHPLHAPLISHLTLLHPSTPREIIHFCATRLLSAERPHGHTGPWEPVWSGHADLRMRTAGLGMEAAKGCEQVGRGKEGDERLEGMYAAARKSWGLVQLMGP